MRLGLTLPASPREMPTSFLSRLAARNLYLSAANFAADLGLKVNAIACGDPDAVRQLTELAGLPADSFARSTVTKTNSMRYLITGEALQTATFDRGAGHICPHCLTEDMARDGALWAAVHQWHWQLRHILTCSRHQRRLVVLPASGAEGRYDYVAALRANPDLWKNEPTDPTVPPPTALETYLSHRCYGEQLPCWADQLGIPALCRASELLGLLIERGGRAAFRDVTPEGRRVMAGIGFATLAAGPASIRAALDHVRSSDPEMAGNQPHPQFGEFQRLLGSNWKNSSEFGPIRDIVRDYLVDHFPFADGADVLGETLPQRRLHSLHSARKVIRRRMPFFEDALIDRGLARRRADESFELLSTLTVDLVDELRAERESLLLEKEAARRFGLTVESFRTLVNAGIVPHRTHVRPHKHRQFWEHEVDAVLSRFTTPMIAINEIGDEDLETVTRATVRASCSLAEIADALMSGRIRPAGVLRGKRRFDHILINVPELKAALPREAVSGLPRIATFRKLRITNATLNWLLAEGLLRSDHARSPDSRLIIEMIDKDSLDRFQRDYVSLGELAYDSPTSPAALYARLRSAGIAAFLDQKPLSRIYRRADLPSDVDTVIQRPASALRPPTRSVGPSQASRDPPHGEPPATGDEGDARSDADTRCGTLQQFVISPASTKGQKCSRTLSTI
ncbi:TniQ family protein [Paracoccus sanguinis]|uniref:TniQ family protein n=1 Tax=Paracoccus sanguinis TaxID=1545044 RepID=UPI0009DD4551|nr:TniQ family protein [Paracoccus sanguinis]